MVDRQSENPGRVKITREDGSVEYVTIERADNPIVAGTPINKATLLDNIASERFDAETPNEAFKNIGKDWAIVVVPLSGWSDGGDGWFTNRVTIDEMRSSFEPYISPVYTDIENIPSIDSNFSLIKEVETYDGYIIAKCVDIPEIDLSIRMAGV